MRGRILKDERGMALVVSLLVLIVLTLIGMSSISSTIFETQISGRDRASRSASYAAEGGAEVGYNQLPSLTAYSAAIGSEGGYRSGEMTAPGPRPLKNLGPMTRPGYENIWEFRRYQVNATGESFSARREIETQVSMGPFAGGTQYNN